MALGEYRCACGKICNSLRYLTSHQRQSKNRLCKAASATAAVAGAATAQALEEPPRRNVRRAAPAAAQQATHGVQPAASRGPEPAEGNQQPTGMDPGGAGLEAASEPEAPLAPGESRGVLLDPLLQQVPDPVVHGAQESSANTGVRDLLNDLCPARMTPSQAAALPILRTLPGRLREKLLQLFGDRNFQPQEVSQRWKTNAAFMAELDSHQVSSFCCCSNGAMCYAQPTTRRSEDCFILYLGTLLTTCLQQLLTTLRLGWRRHSIGTQSTSPAWRAHLLSCTGETSEDYSGSCS